jgi:microcystin-dependent protein
MSDPFVAEIRIFSFNFPPTGWAFCNGQLIPISQNTALFSLCGTMYGGDGKSTFALPNMQGNAPIHQGQGSGLSQYFPGQEGGVPSVTLIQTEIPFHTHTAQVSSSQAASRSPGNAVIGQAFNGNVFVAGNSGNLTPMSPNTLSIAGSSFPHNNMMPYLTLNFCIALQGIFPPRP